MNNTNNLQDTYNKNNQINTPTKQDQPQVNLDYATNLEQETQRTRETALQSYIAGTPHIENITYPTTKPDLQKTEVTKDFTTRDEIMSRLGLMNEDYTYSDTYTHYVQEGGSPLPGYEYAHQTLLDQERSENIFQQVEDGSLSYDQALMEAYGKDILASKFGIDVTSVAYWQNKFQGNDFSNPFSNRYLMDQVRQLADEYHQSRLASEYGQKKTKDTQLASLLGQEVDDLSAKKIKDLFNMDPLKNTLDDDQQFWEAIHNGIIPASMRMTQDSDGTYYYLHTDGQVYKLDGQTGRNHGTLHLDSNGNFEGIELNQAGGIMSFTRSTLSGFARVFTGAADFLSMPISAALSLFNVTDDAFTWANRMDSYLADNADWLVGTGYIDLSDKITLQDAANFAGSMIGTIVGTMALGAVSGSLPTSTSAGKGFLNWGQSLINNGHTIAGNSLKAAAYTLKWQTGNIGTLSGCTTNAQIWGRRLGASLIANSKNAFNDYRKLCAQSALYEDGASESEIFQRVATDMAINFAVDSLISGGMDDNQVQLYKKTFGEDSSLDFLTLSTDEVAARRSIIQEFSHATNPELRQALEKSASSAFKSLMLNRAGTIAVNSSMDLLGNLVTGAISSRNQIDLETGKLKDISIIDSFKDAFTPENIARSAINTLWYSTRSQIRDWNVSLETIGKSHTDFIDKIDKMLADSKKPEDIDTLTKLRQSYINSLNDPDYKDRPYEEKIIHAMDKLCTGMGDTVPETLRKVIMKNGSQEAIAHYQRLYEDGITMFEAKNYRINETLNFQKDNSVKLARSIFTTIKNSGRWLTGQRGADKNVQAEMVANTKFDEFLSKNVALYENKSFQALLKDTDEIVKEEQKEQPLQSISGYDIAKQDGDLKKVLQDKKNPYYNSDWAQYSYYMLPNNGDQTKDNITTKIALDIATDMGYLTLVDADHNLYRVQSYYDQTDFINTANVNRAIYQTVVSLAADNVSEEVKGNIISNFSKTLMDDKVSDLNRATIIANVLERLTKTSLSHATAKGSQTTKPLLTLKEASKIFTNFRENNNIKEIKTKNLNANAALELLSKTGETLMLIQKEHGDRIDLTDKTTRELLTTLHNQGDISDDTYNKIIKLQEENPDSFLPGSRLKSKQKYVENRILTKDLEKLVPIYGVSSQEEVRHKINLYFEDQGIELKNDPLIKDIIKICNEYDTIMSNAKTVTLNEDGRVYIDLDTFQGNTTTKFLNKIITEGNSNKKFFEDVSAFREYNYDLTKEFNNLNEWKANNGSLIAFDTQTASGREGLKTFLDSMNYDVDITSEDSIKKSLVGIEGLTNYRGDTIVLKIDTPENIEDIKTAILENGRIDVGNNTILDFRNVKYRNADGVEEADLDIERAILDTIEIQNIDPSIKIKLKQAPLLQIVPFAKSENGKYNFTTPITTALFGTDASETPRKNAGKQASQTTQQLEHLMIGSAGAETPIDQNLANYFTLDLIARRLCDNPKGMNIPVSNDEAQAFKDFGLVDYNVGKKAVTSDNNFWKLVGPTDSTGQMLVLKTDNLDKFQEYITSEDFNVYRMLPMMFKESEIKNQGIIDVSQTYTTEGYENLIAGFARETGLDILNIRLPWDNATNSLYANFIKEMIAHNETLNWNPLEGAGYTKPVAKEYQDFNEWYEATANSTNPYDIIARRYVDEFYNMVRGDEGQAEYNNESLLIFSRASRKTLLNYVKENPEAKATDQLVNDVKMAIMEGSVPQNRYTAGLSTITSPGARISSSEVSPDVMVVSGKSTAALFNDDNITFENPDFVDLPTVQKALDIIKQVTTTEENAYRQNFRNNYMEMYYDTSDAVKFMKSMAGNDFQVPVTDADYEADLIFENYRKALDGTEEKRIKESMIPTLTYLYGKNYEKVTDEIFKAAQRTNKIVANTKVTMRKHFTAPFAPSIIDQYSTISEAPTLDEKRRLVPPNSPDFERLNTYLQNALDNKVNNSKNVFSKLMDGTSSIIDNEFTDAIDKRTRDIRNLYTSAPYNSETQNLVLAHNSIGLMKTVFNTYDALGSVFKGNDESRMHLANTIVALNAGVDYAGDAVHYIVANKDGSLVDGDTDLMEKYAAANINEFLYNIHKAKDDLQGKVIINTKPQDISNTAAIQMSYKEINNEEDFNTIVQDMFHSFCLDNYYYLTNEARTEKDRSTLINQIVSGQLPTERVNELLQKIPSETYSKLQESKNMYDKFRERTGVQNISRAEFNGVFKTLSAVDINTLSREAIQKFLNDPVGVYRRNEYNLAGITDLSLGIGNPDFFSDKKLKAIHSFQELIAKDPSLQIEESATPSQKALKFIMDELTTNDDAHTLDAIIRDRSFVKMKEEVDSGRIEKAFLVNTDNGEQKYLDSESMKNLVASLESNDAKIPTIVDRMIGFDGETTLIGETKLINLGLVVLNKTETGWVPTRYNLYIDYGTDSMSDVERKALREDIVKNQITKNLGKVTKNDPRFYQENPGYRDVVVGFVNAEGDELMTPSQIRNLLSELITDKTALVGYNSSEADIPWMKAAGIFKEDNDELLRKAIHIDVKTLAGTSQILETKNSGAKDVIAQNLKVVNSASHGGLNDADVTLQLFYKIGALSYNIASLRDYTYKDLSEKIQQFGLTEDETNHLWRQVDSILDHARNEDKNIHTYFDRDFEINTNNVAAATDAFEYLFNKRVADMSWAIREQEFKANYFSQEAISALATNKQQEIGKIWAAARDKGIDQWRVADAFKTTMNTVGACDQDTLLKVLGSDVKLQAVKNALGLTDEDIEKAKPAMMFTTSPDKDPAMAAYKSQYSKYDSLYGSKELYNDIRQIIDAVGVDDIYDKQDLATRLTMLYSFRKGANIDELCKDNVQLLNTKTGKMYAEYLAQNYGDPDAVMSFRRDGIYDLIDAVGVGKPIHDALSNSRINVDSSMVVISPEQFYNLTGKTYTQYLKEHPEIAETGLYSQLLIHPADANEKILPRRIVVQKDATGVVMQVPETVLEVLGARDLDGDHLILLSPDLENNDVLKLYSDNIYKAHDVQEEFLDILRKSGASDYKEYSFINHTIGRNRQILDISRLADQALQENNDKDLASLKKDFDSRVTDILKENNVEDNDKIRAKIDSALWVNEKNLYEVNRNDTPIRFINNPALWFAENGNLSYSGQQRLQAEDQQLVSKDLLYAFIDQTTGVAEKEAIKNLQGVTVSNPWTDLYISGIYGAKVVGKYFDSFDGNPELLTQGLRNSIDKVFGSASLSKEVDSSINAMGKALEDGNKVEAFNLYDKILRQLDAGHRESLNAKDFMNTLTSETMMNKYARMQQQLDNTKRNIDLYNDLARNRKFYGSDTGPADMSQIMLKRGIHNLAESGLQENNINAFEDSTKGTAFIITRFAKGRGPVGIGEDTVLYNNAYETPLVGYSRKVYNLGNSTHNIDSIKEGQMYKAHTIIAKGDSDVRLDSDAMVVRKTDNSIVTLSVSKLGNNFKVTTDIGGKGVVNSLYSTDPSIAFILNKPKQEKIIGGSSDAMNTNEEEITLKYKVDGKTRTVKAYGYRKDDVVFKVAEDTTYWNKRDSRKVDALHVVMDANTINGVLDMGATYSDEEGLQTHPERYAELRDSIFRMNQEKAYTNGWGLVNELKLRALFNVVSDKELTDAWHTDMDAASLKELLLNNKVVNTNKFTSQVASFGDMYKDRIDMSNPILNKLFSDDLYNIIGSYLPTASDDELDLKKITAKATAGLMGNTSDEKADTRKFSLGVRVHNDIDYINDPKGLENLEDINVSLFRIYDYLFDGKPVINTWLANRLIREHKLAYGEILPDTANPENGYKAYDSRYTVANNKANLLIGPSGSYKTAYTTSPAEVISGKPRKVELSVPDVRYRNAKENKSYLSPEMLNLIFDGNVEYINYNNNAKVTRLLYQLQNLNPAMSVDAKKSFLQDTQPNYGIFDSHFGIGIDDNGDPTINLTKHMKLEGNLKELNDKVKKSVHNYAFWNSVKSKVDKSIDSSYIKPKGKSQEVSPVLLNDLYDSLKSDLFDETTGEVKQNINFRDYDADPDGIEAPNVLSGGERKAFKTTLWGRQGISASTELGAALSTAMKNASSVATFLEQDELNNLSELEREVNRSMSMEEFKRFANLTQIALSPKEEKTELMRVFNVESDEQLEKELNTFRDMYPKVAIGMEQHKQYLANTIRAVAERTGISMDSCLPGLMSPYISKDKPLNRAMAFSTLRGLTGLQKYNYLDKQNLNSSSLTFDFFNSSKAIVKELSNMQGIEAIKDTLKNQNMLSNNTLLDQVGTLLNKFVSSEENYYIKKDADSEYTKKVIFDEIYNLTNMKVVTNEQAPLYAQYKAAYDYVGKNLTVMMDNFNNKYTQNLSSYTEFKNFADLTQDINASKDAEVIANFFYAKMLCGQGMIEGSPNLAKAMGERIQSLKEEGYSFVNKYGQVYERNGIINPITSSPLSNLIENAEIKYNSRDEAMWNQFILEKIISGDLYLMQSDVADHLKNEFYTQKHPGPVVEALQKVSKLSAGLQMSLPTKILNRLISFTGFDYSMGAMYDPKVIKYIPEARRQLVAAYQSKGTQMPDELKGYMEREGQPIGLTGKDPVTFSEEFNAPKAIQSVIDTLTDPLEFQNHLGRYAIYLAALDGFENGDPNYGPMYFAKDSIDALGDNRDKAMYIMDYLLGSPGGFPQLAKKTSGIMMYATFPMNYARTMGAYGMSLSKLFSEGFTKENSKYWMRSAITPSMGMAGITAVGMLLTSLICDLFGVTGKEKEDLVYDLQTIDLVGTVIGGTPTKSGSSMNTAENAYTAIFEPFVNKNNDTVLKKLFGVVNTNLISKLNPAIKAPLELMTGYDFMGSSLLNTKQSYSAIENGARKALGFVIGSSTANAIVDQNKIDKYNKDRNFLDSLITGTARGLSASLGNQKSYKRDTTNYYNTIYSINNYRYKTSGTYDNDVDDFIEADSMERLRSYNSKYGYYSEDDYKRISKLVKKAMQKKEDASVIYSIIMDEYKRGVPEYTLKMVLNNNSVSRKLDQLRDKQGYLNSLSPDQYKKLIRALEYEEEFYPLLKEFFPTKSNYSSYINYRQNRRYNNLGNSYGRTYYPRTIRPTFVNYYPNNGYGRSRLSVSSPRASINKVQVEVSPQMGIWTKDYNKIKDLRNWTDYDYNRTKPLNHGGGK